MFLLLLVFTWSLPLIKWIKQVQPWIFPGTGINQPRGQRQQRWHHFPQNNDDISMKWNDDIFTMLQHQWGIKIDVFHSNYTDLTIGSTAAFTDILSLSLFLCLIWGRIVELFCPEPISPHWGVLTKCLSYSKAASDPFVYSLLHHQYRKTCSVLVNRVLKRSPLNSSSVSMANSKERSNSNTTNNAQPNVNKPLGQWRWPPRQSPY